MSKFNILNLPTYTDSRGSLTVLDDLLPFKVARTYWIYGANGQTRGGHRHVHTIQVLIALAGTISIYMNDGFNEETIVLNQPNQCLLVEPKDWHIMTFGRDSILLALSSHPYNRDEYIDKPYD
jgi:hypothetical protein